ncbi:MAG: L-threonylcarbamoyladenylate synthase [Pseudomonadota bacterium]
MNTRPETPGRVSDLDREIAAAARILEHGGLVAFPTETVYGLGADAENPVAVGAIYAAKGRPANHPLIVHLATNADPGYWSSNVNIPAQKLIAAFWPGPLTLILPRATHISDVVTGGQASIGLRCPAHPVAQALLHTFKTGGGGIAAPSANRFGHVSPTTASHVREEFRDSPWVGCILEGGQSAVGIESTILDLTRDRPVLLRPGGISSVEIAELLGVMPGTPDVQAPRVSGSLASHYAPRTPVALVSTGQLPQTLKILLALGRRVALMHHTVFAAGDLYAADAALGSSTSVATHAWPAKIEMAGNLVRRAMPSDPSAYAHDLYAVLRQLDQAGTDMILVEALPKSNDWQAVGDRLTRAAHGSESVLQHLIGA